MKVRGAYMTIKEFLYTYKEGVVYAGKGNEEQDTWRLKAGRKLIIPDYQREYRWEEKQLTELVEDIIDGNCYLGQIAVSHNISEPEKYYLVDGQQRITSIIMLLTVLCRQFFQAKDHINFKHFELHSQENNEDNPNTARLSFTANCFEGFQDYLSQIYKLATTSLTFQHSLHSNKIPMETFVNYALQIELITQDSDLKYGNFDDELRYNGQGGKQHICQLITATDLHRSMQWIATFFQEMHSLLEMDAR